MLKSVCVNLPKKVKNETLQQNVTWNVMIQTLVDVYMHNKEGKEGEAQKILDNMRRAATSFTDVTFTVKVAVPRYCVTAKDVTSIDLDNRERVLQYKSRDPTVKDPLKIVKDHINAQKKKEQSAAEAGPAAKEVSDDDQAAASDEEYKLQKQMYAGYSTVWMVPMMNIASVSIKNADVSREGAIPPGSYKLVTCDMPWGIGQQWTGDKASNDKAWSDQQVRFVCV
jgi:hypothetical protein